MDALINKFKEKLISLERSTEEVQAIFKDIFSRIENVEYPVNGDNLKKMLTNLASRLDAIESDISQMKSNITTNSKDIDTHTKRLDSHEEQITG